MTRSSTKVTLRAQLTCALPVSYTCNRPVDINESRSKFISRCHRVASGDSPHSETLNGNCRPEKIWVDGGGISLGRYPLAYCVSAYNFHQTSFTKFKATLSERKKAKVGKVGQRDFQLSAQAVLWGRNLQRLQLRNDLR